MNNKPSYVTIVSGSRTIQDRETIFKHLNALPFTVSKLISNNQIGVGQIAAEWAKEKNIPVEFFAPDWKAEPKLAIFRSNDAMIRAAGPDGAAVILWDGEEIGSIDLENKVAKERNMSLMLDTFQPDSPIHTVSGADREAALELLQKAKEPLVQLKKLQHGLLTFTETDALNDMVMKATRLEKAVYNKTPTEVAQKGASKS